MPRRSKIEGMPAAARAWLEQVLSERDHEGYVALSALVKSKGFDISHAAIHRHDQKVQRTLGAIRASTEAARLIVATSPDAADDRSAAVISMVQSHLFDAMLQFSESQDEDITPAQRLKLLGQAASSIANISRASAGNKEFAGRVRDKLAQMESVANNEGKRLDAETLKVVREALYGG